jgi:hypothetical protein
MRRPDSFAKKHKEKRRELNFLAIDVAVEDECHKRGLELVARLLLERREARHTAEKPDVEEGS